MPVTTSPADQLMQLGQSYTNPQGQPLGWASSPFGDISFGPSATFGPRIVNTPQGDVYYGPRPLPGSGFAQTPGFAPGRLKAGPIAPVQAMPDASAGGAGGVTGSTFSDSQIQALIDQAMARAKEVERQQLAMFDAMGGGGGAGGGGSGGSGSGGGDSGR